MEEKLYTIPVMDAFKVDCECPLCKMRDDIEKSIMLYHELFGLDVILDNDGKLINL